MLAKANWKKKKVEQEAKNNNKKRNKNKKFLMQPQIHILFVKSSLQCATEIINLMILGYY